MGNIEAAARAGVEHGAVGILTTDWGDMGHHQQPVISEPGLATAAAFSWCAGSHAGLGLAELAEMLDVHAFDDPTGSLGTALVDLGRVPRLVTPQIPNMSALVFSVLLPQWRVGRGATRGLTSDDLDRVEAVLDERGRRSRPGPAPAVKGSEGAGDQIRATVALLRLASSDARLRLAGDGSLASVAAVRPGPAGPGPRGGHGRAPAAVGRGVPTGGTGRQRGLVRPSGRLLPQR